MRKEFKTLKDFRGISEIKPEHYEVLANSAIEKLLKAKNDEAYKFIIDKAIVGDKDAFIFIQNFSSREYAPLLVTSSNCFKITRAVTEMAIEELKIRVEKEKIRAERERAWERGDEITATAVWTEEIGITGFADQLNALKVKPDFEIESIKHLQELIEEGKTTRHIRYFKKSELQD